MSDQYDDALEQVFPFGAGVPLGWREKVDTLLRTQVAQALKPVEEERDRLKEQNASLIRGAHRLRCPAHSLDASNGWGCPVCVFELRQQLAEARGLLERWANPRTRGASLTLGLETRAFLAPSPAASVLHAFEGTPVDEQCPHCARCGQVADAHSAT